MAILKTPVLENSQFLKRWVRACEVLIPYRI
jgi:hypothetical protein